MSNMAAAARGSTLTEIRIEIINFWEPLTKVHFPSYTNKNYSGKWIEEFSYPGEEKTEVIKITEYDTKQAGGMFYELVEGTSTGYKYINKFARVLYFYEFKQEDVDSGILYPITWTHTSKGTEKGYYLKLSDLLEVSSQPLSVLKADSSLVSSIAVNFINKSGLYTPLVSRTSVSGKPRVLAGNSFYSAEMQIPKHDTKIQDEKTSKTDYPSEDDYSEKEDDHISKMTIRDRYCITHNVPLSNKKWLNELIIKGKSWLQ
jgi:hypothetical protein